MLEVVDGTAEIEVNGWVPQYVLGELVLCFFRTLPKAGSFDHYMLCHG